MDVCMLKDYYRIIIRLLITDLKLTSLICPLKDGILNVSYYMKALGILLKIINNIKYIDKNFNVCFVYIISQMISLLTFHYLHIIWIYRLSIFSSCFLVQVVY